MPTMHPNEEQERPSALDASKAPRDPYFGLDFDDDTVCHGLLMLALDRESPAAYRAELFLALAAPPPAGPKTCKILYAEGVRLLASPRGRALNDDTRDRLQEALRAFARVFLRHLRPDAPDIT